MTKPTSPTQPARLVVLYDRDCGFCLATVRWLRRRDRAGRLQLVALQDALSSAAGPWGSTVAGHDLRSALHVIETASGRVLEGGPAMLAVLGTLPRWRMVARLAAARPLNPFVDQAYRAVAGHRSGLGRLVGAAGPACRVPPAGRGSAS